MWNRFFALVSVGSVTYFACLAATTTGVIVALFGISVLNDWGWILMDIILTGTVGLLATSLVVVIRRRLIANSTVGGWLRAVGLSGAIQGCLIAIVLIANDSMHAEQTLLGNLIFIIPPVLLSMLLIRSGRFGLLTMGDFE